MPVADGTDQVVELREALGRIDAAEAVEQIEVVVRKRYPALRAGPDSVMPPLADVPKSVRRALDYLAGRALERIEGALETRCPSLRAVVGRLTPDATRQLMYLAGDVELHVRRLGGAA